MSANLSNYCCFSIPLAGSGAGAGTGAGVGVGAALMTSAFYLESAVKRRVCLASSNLYLHIIIFFSSKMF